MRVGASDALDSMLRNVGVQVIEQVDEHDRGELFTRTAEKFVALRNAAAPGGESPVVFEPPDLSRDVFDNSLMVVIAAYLAAPQRRCGADHPGRVARGVGASRTALLEQAVEKGRTRRR